MAIVVPSLYYDFMQAQKYQQKAVLAGKCGIFKALRKYHWSTDYCLVVHYLTDNELFNLQNTIFRFQTKSSPGRQSPWLFSSIHVRCRSKYISLSEVLRDFSKSYINLNFIVIVL
ncbi:Hypothetical_protein [Hexamita inflata]|uniref:Hypothetical_protein n=1 Tax=Hexamita inflata TaxID=28002 RepID=A0AA86NI97_9EUKA|nr:Hypothetical protein HINF_LOCUS8094 [Hexamita inflata]